MKKVLFIDRDGTIISEPPDEQVDSFAKMSFLPGVITALSRLKTETEYTFVMVTNQDGLGTDSFPEESFWPVHNKMLEILKGEGIVFEEIFIDRTFPHENAATRKPGTAMLTGFLAQGVNLSESYVIGDRLTDLGLAKNIGCGSILIGNTYEPQASLCTSDWKEIVSFLINQPRTAHIVRKTRETDITVSLNLDGSGKFFAQSGIGFFDHMLEQIARHSNADLSIKIKGDLSVDEHHSIEDTALALGEAFNKALGQKKGIERYGFVLPMDDSLASVAIDFGGRPWLVWDVNFKREKIGDLPSEMLYHFFKSFSDSARCNLNIKAEGENEHHKAEAIFKSFAKAIGMAISKTGRFNLPSTKGVL